ncbi:MAG: hypothetical protein B0D92_03920 [Spirochaeta sp. LUC14_002_19_P3]|nr:MAG: hypothetical protein B0D92_03920 [Spirochaeta sp. LUC14_002_19_P3]
MDTVSVIIPTYNRSIIRALESVMAQTWRNLEIIIVDDGSTDGSTDGTRMKAWIEQSAVRIIRTANRGVAAARNTGVEAAAGPWIAFLDSDDTWAECKLEKQMRHIRAHPDIRIVYTSERWIRRGVRVNPPKAYRKYGGDVFLHCLPVCLIAPSSVLMQLSLFREMGGFDPAYPVCEDYDLWLRICSLYPVGLVDEELTVKYGGHADQLSASSPVMDYWRIRALCGILQTRKLSPPHLEAVRREIIRKAKIFLPGCLRHGRSELHEQTTDIIRASGVTPGHL